MPRGREQPRRRVFRCQHGAHAWNLKRGGLVDRHDPGVGVLRAQHLDVQQSSIAVSKV